MLSWTRLCVNTVLYGLLLVLFAILDVSALELSLSSSSSTYYYEIALDSEEVADSSCFLFTLAPLDHVLESVVVTDATEMQSTVQLSQQFGLHALSLSEFTAPVYIWFAIPSSLPLTNVVTGVGCFENSESLEVHCRYLPTLDLAPPKYIATVVPLDAENKNYGLHFQLPYLLTSIDVAHQYRAMVMLNNIFSVNTDNGSCRDPDLFVGGTTTQCALNVVPSTTPKYPNLPYEAILPLKSYSHARASATFTDNLILLSFNITHVKPRASLLDYIAQHARVVSDPNDTDLFRVFALNESEPSEVLYPDEDPGFGRYLHMSPVKNNWIPQVPPVESLFLRGLIGVFDVIVPGDGETPPSTSAMTGIMMVAGDQGFYMRDTLQLTVNVNLQADDTFISQYASCYPLLPQNITCVLTNDVLRLNVGASAFLIHSKAFERVDELTVSIEHDVPKTAAISFNPNSDVQMASLAGHATQLQRHFKAFNNLVLKSSPRASGSEVNIYIAEPEYYESSLTTVHADMTNVLMNQKILVEVGCLLENSDLVSKNDMCTRVANRIYSCPTTYGVSEALHGDPYSVNIDKFMWHRDIGYRASPVILKRVLINDPSIALETSSTNVHSTQAFRFETSGVSATVRRENTTLTADFHADQVPRLLYPSVDRFVFNATAPLFRDALARALTIAGAFTPFVQVTNESTDPTTAPVETWEPNTAAVVPLECYPVTAFAVACLVTAETVATHGQVSVTLVHNQPAAAPHTMSISMSIYTSTDISACGGRDPIEATVAALRVAAVPTNDGSSSVASAFNGFVTADADIAAARRHVQRLAAEWRAHGTPQAQRMQTMSIGTTVAAAPALESVLPSDWSLAHMSTKADVQVTVLWSPSTSTSTFWALNPAVIWLWPFLGAVLLAVVAYRIYVIRRRKSTAVHPGTLAAVCEKEPGKAAYMASQSSDVAPQKHCGSYFLPIAAEPNATRDAKSWASGLQSAAEIELAAKYQSDDAHASVDIQCDMEVESVHDDISGNPIESASVPQTCTEGVDVKMTSELAMTLPPVARASSLFIAPDAYAQSYADVMSLNASELRESMESYLPIAASFLRRKSFEVASSPILSRFSPNLADTQRISANAQVNIVLPGALDEIRSVTPLPLEILESTSLRSSLTSLAVSSECLSPRSSHFTAATTVCKSAAAMSDVSFADRSSNTSSSSGISNQLSDNDIKPSTSVVSARDVNRASQCRPVVPVLTLPLVHQIITQTPLSLLSDPRASFKGDIATPHGTEPREHADCAHSVSCGLHTQDAHSRSAVTTPLAATMPVWSAGDKSAIIGLDHDITHLSIGSEHDSLSNNSEPMLIYQPPLSPVSDYSLRNEVRQIIGYPEPSISGGHFLLSTRSLPANLREREAI